MRIGLRSLSAAALTISDAERTPDSRPVLRAWRNLRGASLDLVAASCLVAYKRLTGHVESPPHPPSAPPTTPPPPAMGMFGRTPVGRG